jgi:hypothetical protein
MTLALTAIDLASGRQPGMVRVTLTTARGQKVDFNLASHHAAALGASLSEHAGNL